MIVRSHEMSSRIGSMCVSLVVVPWATVAVHADQLSRNVSM